MKCTFCNLEIDGRETRMFDSFERKWHLKCQHEWMDSFLPSTPGSSILASDAYQECNYVLLDECMAHFQSKQADYAGTFLDLGAKGQFSDMNRKIGKLRLAIMDELEMVHESPQEITRDLFGHVLLMLYCLKKEL